MIEKQSYQEPFSEVDKRKDDEMEIDLMAIFYKIITVRGVLCKAAGVGVIIQCRWNWFYYWNNCSGKYP